MNGTADLYAGQFTSQPLVFAHLWDVVGPDLNADLIEVICNQDPRLRLQHWFSLNDAKTIEDAMGVHTTCVIVFQHITIESAKLVSLGTFQPLHMPTA